MGRERVSLRRLLLLQWLNDSEVGPWYVQSDKDPMRGKGFRWGDGQVENWRRVELGSAGLVLASRGEEKGLVEGCAWVNPRRV